MSTVESPATAATATMTTPTETMTIALGRPMTYHHYNITSVSSRNTNAINDAVRDQNTIIVPTSTDVTYIMTLPTPSSSSLSLSSASTLASSTLPTASSSSSTTAAPSIPSYSPNDTIKVTIPAYVSRLMKKPPRQQTRHPIHPIATKDTKDDDVRSWLRMNQMQSSSLMIPVQLKTEEKQLIDAISNNEVGTVQYLLRHHLLSLLVPTTATRTITTSIHNDNKMYDIIKPSNSMIHLNCSVDDIYKNTPIMVTIHFDYFEITKMLVKALIIYNCRVISDRQQHVHATTRYTNIIHENNNFTYTYHFRQYQYLDVNIKDTDGWTMLHYLANRKHRENTPTFSTSPSYAPTTLTKAVYEDNILQILQLLLSIPDIDINCRDKLGNTPLHIASFYGSLFFVKCLCEHPGIDINCVNDYWNETPLYKAVQYHREDIVEYFLSCCHNIDLHVRDFEGRNCYQLAHIRQVKEIILLIEKAYLLEHHHHVYQYLYYEWNYHHLHVETNKPSLSLSSFRSFPTTTASVAKLTNSKGSNMQTSSPSCRHNVNVGLDDDNVIYCDDDDDELSIISCASC